MGTSRLDSKRRIVLPSGEPGDVFDVQQLGDGRFVLVRLEKPAHQPISKESVLKAIDEYPLTPSMSWESLRAMTREP